MARRSTRRRSNRRLGGRCSHSGITVYNIIYADPPWNYSNNQCDDPTRGGKSYPLMSQDKLKALPVASIAAPDCVLFLWATMPKLQEALDVIAAWGFRHITCAFTWVKINPTGQVVTEERDVLLEKVSIVGWGTGPMATLSCVCWASVVTPSECVSPSSRL